MLKTNNKKERGEFGELTARVWLTPAEAEGRRVLQPGAGPGCGCVLIVTTREACTARALYRSLSVTLPYVS